MSAKTVTIEATIAAEPEKVWLYWTEPRHITQWNFANNDWCCPRAENEVKVGGKYSARMEAKDGSFGFDFEATYDDVKPLKKLAYTMPDGRKVLTSFDQQRAGTKVTTTFDAESENSLDMQRAGWQSILNNFKRYVESN